ncbi:MAG TPA: hypothetical protein V6C65_32095 [Allocoleopsis sp.]
MASKYDVEKLIAKKAIMEDRKTASLALPVTVRLERGKAQECFAPKRTKIKIKWATNSHLDRATKAQVFASRFYKEGYRLIIDGMTIWAETRAGDRKPIARIKDGVAIRLYAICEETETLEDRLLTFIGVRREEKTSTLIERACIVAQNERKDAHRGDLYRENKKKRRPGRNERRKHKEEKERQHKLY